MAQPLSLSQPLWPQVQEQTNLIDNQSFLQLTMLISMQTMLWFCFAIGSFGCLAGGGSVILCGKICKTGVWSGGKGVVEPPLEPVVEGDTGNAVPEDDVDDDDDEDDVRPSQAARRRRRPVSASSDGAYVNGYVPTVSKSDAAAMRKFKYFVTDTSNKLHVDPSCRGLLFHGGFGTPCILCKKCTL